MRNYDRDEFLNQLEYKNSSNVQKAKNVLNIAADYEEKYDKPLCEFTKADIDRMYKEMESVSISDLQTTHLVYKRYVDWCIANGYKGDNNFNEFSNADIVLYVKKDELISLNELRLYRSYFENPVDRFILASPYFGFSSKNGYEDYDDLIEEKFDTETNEILLPGRIISVPDWFIKDAIDAINTYEIIRDGKVKVYLTGDEVIKAMKRNEDDKEEYEVNLMQYISKKFSRVIKPTLNDNEAITHYNIARSGIVANSKRIMEKYGVTTLKELFKIEEFKTDVLARYRVKDRLWSFNQAYGKYLEQEQN